MFGASKAASRRVIVGTVGGLALVTMAAANGAVTVDGTLDADYGPAKVVQNNGTGFGDVTGGSNVEGSSTGSSGSELDGGYGVVENGTLYLMLTGNLELNYNHLNVFIGTTGSANTVTYTAGGALANTLNGSVFPTNMQPIFAVDANGGGSSPTTLYVDQYNLLNNSTQTDNYVQPTSPGGNSGTLNNGLVVALNDTNAAGVDGNTSGDAATESAAAALVTTGFELSIPLSSLGNPTGPLQIVAAINGGGDGYLSNQFLGGLTQGSGNIGSSAFNAATSGISSFAVAVPEPASLSAFGLLGLIGLRRKFR